MSKYVTKSGQNLYDVALAVYGSIEGIFDLLLSNTNITLDTTLTKGMELEYHEDFIINQDIVTWLNDNDIKVKNGKMSVFDNDISSAIKSWILQTNFQLTKKYQTGELASVFATDDGHGNLDFFDEEFWQSEEDESVAVVSEDEEEPNGPILGPSEFKGFSAPEITSKDIETAQQSWFLTKILEITGVDLSDYGDSNVSRNLSIMYSNGMIVTPSITDELQTYYENVITPKLLIQQTGKSSEIDFQIPANEFVAIDWGDETDFSFFHFETATAKATHTYKDSGEHKIIVYGTNQYLNLNLSKVSGTYYALSEIIIDGQLVTAYPNATSLNKLFIIKDNNE